MPMPTFNTIMATPNQSTRRVQLRKKPSFCHRCAQQKLSVSAGSSTLIAPVTSSSDDSVLPETKSLMTGPQRIATISTSRPSVPRAETMDHQNSRNRRISAFHNCDIGATPPVA
jgi:hypothetical protein